MDLNRWEFPKWGANKVVVEKILVENGINLKLTNNDPFYDQITRFEFDGFNTTLFFDEHYQLIRISQEQDFSIMEKDVSRSFYEKKRAEYLEKLGPVYFEQNDTEKELVTIEWQLDLTSVVMRYDYQYKIIDEFGAGSYTVTILSEPRHKVQN